MALAGLHGPAADPEARSRIEQLAMNAVTVSEEARGCRGFEPRLSPHIPSPQNYPFASATIHQFKPSASKSRGRN